jgi:hypothetical protein
VAASVTLTTTLPALSRYEPAVLEPNWASSLLASVDGANDGSTPAPGAADAGDATNAEPTSMKAARPTIGRRSFRLSTCSSHGGLGGTPLQAYRAPPVLRFLNMPTRGCERLDGPDMRLSCANTSSYRCIMTGLG